MDIIRKNKILMFFVILTTAICLRAPITSVGSILYCIVADLNLSNTIAGSITTIPLIVMAVLSPCVSKLGEKYGIDKSLFIGLLIMFIGIIVRSVGHMFSLLLGTALIGTGIAFGNVLIPGIIKKFFPNKMGTLTGVFTTTMSVCSGIGAGLSVPLAVGIGWGWRLTLGIWAITVFVAIVISAIQIIKMPAIANSGEALQNKKAYQKPLYKIPLAWWITIMFGSQSCVFFMMVTWLPTIVIDRGVSAVVAGAIATIFQIAAIPANLGTPILAEHFKNQRKLAVSVSSLGIIGLLGIMFADSILILSISTGFLALGLGGSFSLCLVMFGLRTSNGIEAARLSGFSQSIGYIMAAIGPALAGGLYDLSGSWQLTIVVAIIIFVMVLFSGNIVGADRKI